MGWNSGRKENADGHALCHCQCPHPQGTKGSMKSFMSLQSPDLKIKMWNKSTVEMVNCCSVFGSSRKKKGLVPLNIQRRILCRVDVNERMKEPAKYREHVFPPSLCAVVFTVKFLPWFQHFITYLWHGNPLKPFHMSHLNAGGVCCSRDTDIHRLVSLIKSLI